MQQVQSRQKTLRAVLPHAPRVHDYADYRTFLKDWLTHAKKFRRISLKKFSDRAGLKSHTLPGMILRGDRRLTTDLAHAFGKAMELSARDLTYFEKLVRFQEARTQSEKIAQYISLASQKSAISNSAFKRVADYARYYSDWHVTAIRELAYLPGFKANPEWIQKKLKNTITIAQANEALATLQELKLIEAQADGTLRAGPGSIDHPSEGPNYVLRNYHVKILERAREAALNEPVEQRTLSALTLPVSEAQYAKIQERLEEFRKEICLSVSQDSNPADRVVTISMQLLSLTDSTDSPLLENSQ